MIFIVIFQYWHCIHYLCLYSLYSCYMIDGVGSKRYLLPRNCSLLVKAIILDCIITLEIPSPLEWFQKVVIQVGNFEVSLVSFDQRLKENS